MSRDVDVGDMVTIKGKTINKNFIIDNISSDENYFYIDIYDILDNDFKLKLYGLDDKWKIYEKNIVLIPFTNNPRIGGTKHNTLKDGMKISQLIDMRIKKVI